MAYRPERLAETIKQEVANILRDEVKDPRVGFATITKVEVSADLRHAKIYVSVLGEKKEQDASMEALQKAKGFIRAELGKRVRLRYVPEVNFILDHSIDYGTRVLKLLNKVKEKGEMRDGES